MQNYSQLNSEQRYQIFALLKKTHTQSDIASIVGVRKPTISREIRRNRRGRGYWPKQVHVKALQKRDEKVRFDIAESTRQRVEKITART